jgi:hypothetical protein
MSNDVDSGRKTANKIADVNIIISTEVTSFIKLTRVGVLVVVVIIIVDRP